jgi:hypothetical protein
MPSLKRLELTDVIALGSALRAASAGAAGLEEAAARMVTCLYDALVEDETLAPRSRECALVRLFMTQRIDQLDPELKAFARGLIGDRPIAPELPCLVLVATRGAEAAWNARRTSAGHQAIPLPDEPSISRLPMVSEVFRQLGLEPTTLLRPDREVVRALQLRQCGVFLVPEAEGSSLIPSQRDFVYRYGIRSVLGFGGMLPEGELFAMLLFSRVPVSRDTADALTPLSLSVKLGLLPYSGERALS